MAKQEITNILDYMIWRGDLTFDQDHFNEVDALILARFSYMDMKGILNNDDPDMTIAKAYGLYHENEELRPKYAPQDPELFKLMAYSNRYKDLKVMYHDFQFDEDDVEQFSTVAVELPNHYLYLSFRGTDNSINGWKEDLMMTFDEHVASQDDALAYINYVASQCDHDLLLGGHSKGGNLAIYAALFCHDDIAKRIKGVFSFDGPGLHESLVKTIDDKIALPVIATYVPQSSIFGKMLSHQELMVTVHSDAGGIMQHDIYTWEVIRKDFVLTPQDTATSRVFDGAFHDYLAKLTRDQRKMVVDIIFDALDECDVKTMDDLGKHMVSNLVTVVKHMRGLDEAQSKVIKDAMAVLGDSIKEGILDEITSIIPFIKNKDDDQTN